MVCNIRPYGGSGIRSYGLGSLLRWLIVSCFLCTSAWHCGVYSFKGALPSHIKTVAIPLFDDRTAYPGVRENLTNRLIQEFTSDNTLKVVDESKADVLLSGTITSISQVAATVSEGETVSEYKVTVNVKAKAEDVAMSKVLFDKTFSQYGLMGSDGGQDEFDSAVEEAIQLITEDMLNTMLGGW